MYPTNNLICLIVVFLAIFDNCFTRGSSADSGHFRGLLGYRVDNCFDDPIEQRVRKSDFIFTGTIRKIQRENGEVKTSFVEIKRIFKGENRLDLLILSEVEGRFLPVKYKVCIVEGFENENICFKKVFERDTWLFFTNAEGGRLFLNSSLAKLSIVSIARTEAAAKGQQYISPKITYFNLKGQDECPHKPCPFGGQCHKNLISGYYQCRCMFDCTRDERVVCGSDGETYKNSCQLNKTSCLMKKAIEVLHEGSCEAKDPCLNVTCLLGSKCISRGPSYACACTRDDACDKEENNSIEGSFEGRNDVLCGTDGREYSNMCQLKYKMCLNQKEINVSHRGSCDPCQNLQCHFGATCIIHDNKLASCACQQNCSQVIQKQCGSDGVTYDNICFMNRASCLRQQEITLLHNGPCVVTCDDEECRYGSTCIEGQCVCPSNCSTEEEPVCGTDGLTHVNECALLSFSCNQRLPITVAYLGDCEEDVHVEDACEDMTCLYGGRCDVSLADGKRVEKCLCSFICEDERMSVCGSDKRIYLNECYLMRSSCRKQTLVEPRPMQFCQGSTEEFCDGFPVMRNQSTGEELQCAGEIVDDCPPEGYCHIIENGGRCCQGYQVVSGCEMSEYGCCPDLVTAALGPDYFGCDLEDELACQCNSLGSLEATCGQDTRRCNCKPRVAGMRCDRCESNYWGFLRIADGEDGCQACNCNEYGSLRDDCDQMTGQCMCLENVTGVKCDMCSDGYPITEQGCSGETAQTANSQPQYVTSQLPSKTKRPKISKHTRIHKVTKANKTRQNTETADYATLSSVQVEVTENADLTTADITYFTGVNNVSMAATYNETDPEIVINSTTSPITTSATTLPTTTENISSSEYTTPYFTGDSFVELKPLEHGSRDISIEIGFRALSLNGLLFYTGHLNAKKGDFISIAIINGSLELRYDLGSGSTTLKIPSGVKLNQLHRASAVRHGRDGLLKLDDELKDAGLSPGQIRSLDLGLPIYLGSVPDKSTIEQRNSHVRQGFHGCIDFLRIMSSELNYEYDLCKTSSPDILSDRKTYDCRDSCTDYECIKEMSCQPGKEFVFACKCPERNYGIHCEFEDFSMEVPNNHTDLRKRIL